MTQPFPRTAFWTYPLAFLGAHLAFMPLFVLLLPRRVEALAPESTATALSWLLLTGGLVAGIANVSAGAIGDRWIIRFGNRRGLIAIGAGMLVGAYLVFAFASTLPELFGALIFFQLSLNCCFSPLGALLADHFPDAVKGRLGGLLTAALPASSLLVLPIAWLFPEDSPGAFVLIGGLILVCVLPLLTMWSLGPVIHTSSSSIIANSQSLRIRPSRTLLFVDFSLAWLSRLLIQTGAAFVIGYLYLYITVTQLSQAQWRSAGASEILAGLTAPAAILAIAGTLFAGLISDRVKSRRLPLAVFAGLFAVGMGTLASSTELVWFFIGYGVLQAALAAYLSVDTALIAQLVSGHARRGVLLGVMNLSNTFPSVIVPSIALMAFTDNTIAGILALMFAGFALAAILAGGLIMMIRSVR
ncbi:MAG: MFS transporter [Pseudomonadota bacterium]